MRVGRIPLSLIELDNTTQKEAVIR